MCLINNLGKAKQLVLFDGLMWDGASLTDIDFCLEFHNKVWVIGEVKSQGVYFPAGQRKLMARFINMVRASGKRAIAIVVDHNVWNWKEPVMLRNCMVREYYTTETGRWAFPRRPYYVGEMIDTYLEMCGVGGECNGQIASYLQSTG